MQLHLPISSMAKSAGFKPSCTDSIPAFEGDLTNGPVGEEDVET